MLASTPIAPTFVVQDQLKLHDGAKSTWHKMTCNTPCNGGTRPQNYDAFRIFLNISLSDFRQPVPKIWALDYADCRALCPLYLKILYFLAGPKLRNQPARSLSSARPSLAAIFRVLILRKDLRIRTALVTDVDSTTSGCNLAKPFFEPSITVAVLL